MGPAAGKECCGWTSPVQVYVRSFQSKHAKTSAKIGGIGCSTPRFDMMLFNR
jgi:hypothetical protein